MVRVSPFIGLFLSLSVIFANSHRTLKPGDPGLRDQFLQVTFVPCEVFVPLTGSVGGWFGFSPFNGMFLTISVIFANYLHTLKPGDPGLRGQFLQVTLVPCEVFVPPTGSFGGWFGFSPFNGLFSTLSDFRKLSSYSQTGRPGTTRSVPTSYIDPVRGVRASYGVVWGLVWVFTL